MKAMIVYNPAAGLHAPPAEMSEVVRLLNAEGIEVVGPKPTLGPGDATTYAREAVAQGCEAIFVVGGDGTLAQVADGLIGSDTALGVLPGGTGNVFARQLNLPVAGPLHPKPMLEATRALLAGNIRRVDVGSVTLQGGIVRHFLAWSGIGFDAMVNRAVNADPERKRQLGLAAFALTAFMSLRDMAGTATRLRVDGTRANCRLLMLVVNNIQLYGVVFKMAENAVIDDGELDVYAFQGKDPSRILLHTARLALRRHVTDPQVGIYRGRRIEIAPRRPLPVHVDGDYVGETPAIIEILPHALNLMVPASAPPGLFMSGAGIEQHHESVGEWMQRVAHEVQHAIKERSAAS